MKAYEYKSVPFRKMISGHYQELDVDKLNELGNDGWGLVVIESGNCIFKRSTKMKYYFICYEFTKTTMKGWEKSNCVTDKHPVVWLKEMIDEYTKIGEQFNILFWNEIKKEHFDLIDGWID